MYGGGNRDQGIDFTGSGSLTATADVVDSKKTAAGLFVYGHCGAANGADVTFIGPSGSALTSSGLILHSSTNTLNVSGNAKMVARGETIAVQDNSTGSYYSTVSYAAPYYLNVGTLSDGSDASAYAGTGSDNAKDLAGYKYVSFETADLFIGGVPIAASDAAAAVNALYPGSVTGSANYDISNHKLSLNGAAITNGSTGSSDIN